jgi:hypothetical protein
MITEKNGFLRIISDNFVNKCQQMSTAIFSEKVKKNYGKAFFSLKIKYSSLKGHIFKNKNIFFHFSYKGLRFLKLDIYKCPFSKKIMKLYSEIFAHNFYNKNFRPFIIRNLKRVILAFYMSLAPHKLNIYYFIESVEVFYNLCHSYISIL